MRQDRGTVRTDRVCNATSLPQAGGRGKARLLAREDALAEALAARGFRIVDMDGLDLQALADSLRYARTVVMVEGSHVNHVHFLAPRGFDLCVLMPDDRTTFVYRGLANAFGGRFGYLSTQGRGGIRGKRYQHPENPGFDGGRAEHGSTLTVVLVAGMKLSLQFLGLLRPPIGYVP